MHPPTHPSTSTGGGRSWRSAMPALSMTILAVLGGCLTDGDVGRGTTDETNTARIVGPGGSSAPGAEILVFKLGDTTQAPVYVAQADEMGRYTFDGLAPGRYNLVVTRGDLALYRDSVVLGPTVYRVDTLAHPGSLSGRIEIEPGHDPRTVTVQALGTELWSNVDSAGIFRIVRVPSGDYTLRAVTTLPDYTPTFAHVRAFDDSAVALRDPIRMIYTGTEPRIVRPDGSPAAGAIVKIYGLGEQSTLPKLTTVTDVGGRYELGGLNIGILGGTSYNLVVEDGDLALYRGNLPLVAKGRRIDTLGHPGSLEGRVEVRPGHDPRLSSVQIAGTGLWSNVDSAGVFRFPRIARGQYSLIVSIANPDYQTAVVNVSAFDDSAVALADVIRPVFLGVPPIQGLAVAYDTAAGVARISWRREAGVESYRVRSLHMPATLDRAAQDTSVTDTVFQMGRFLAGSSFHILNPAEVPPVLRYEVCGRVTDGRIGGCVTASAAAMAPYEKVRHSGMRWTKLGSSETGIEDWQNFSTLLIDIRRDTLWRFISRSTSIWNSSEAPHWFAAWKSGDGVHWEHFADSLPVDDWSSRDQHAMEKGSQTPRVWNDTIWAFRVVADTLQLVASADGLDWREVPLPRKYQLRQGERLLFPQLLPTPAGLEIHFLASYPPAAPRGVRRNSSGEWEDGAMDLISGMQDMYDLGGYERLSVVGSDVWAAFWCYYSDSVRWIAKIPATTVEDRRRIPARANHGRIVGIDSLLYMMGTLSTGGPDSGAMKPVLYVTGRENGSPWWALDLPEGLGVVSVIAVWNGRLYLKDGAGNAWLGEPTAAP